MALQFRSAIAYQENNADSTASIPLVFIHGAGSSHLGFPAAFRHRTAFHTLALDLPNHGQSDRQNLSSIPDYAVELEHFLAALDIQHAALVGHSMGAAIALQLALHQPHVCAGLVLMAYAPPPFLDEKDLADSNSAEPSEIALTVFREKLFTSIADPLLRARLSQPLDQVDQAVLHNDLCITCHYQPTFPEEKIPIPLLYLFGQRDPFLDPLMPKALLAHFTSPVVRILPQAGHLLMWEYPTLIWDYLQDFLKPLL
jgi:pimeloyl-ACP methyl ester carboxylesterase